MKPATRRAIAALVLVVGVCIAAAGIFMPQLMTLSLFSLYESYAVKLGLFVVGTVLAVCAAVYLRGRQRKSLERLFVNALLFAVVLVVCLGIFEGVLQLTRPKPLPSYKQLDPVLDHSMIPNARTRFVAKEWNIAVNIDSDGLRDDPVGPKPKVRVMMLGDSFTWGWGVEANQTASSVLERNLQQQGYSLDVLDTGVASYSPILEYLYLKNHGLSLKPDIVVLNFDMSDVHDDMAYESHAVFQNGTLVAVPGQQPVYHPLIVIFQNVLLVNYLQGVLDRAYGVLVNKSEMDEPWARDLHYNVYAILRNDVNQSQFSADWQRSFGYIEKIRELCSQNNITFVLSTYPYAVQVSENEWRYGRHRFGFSNHVMYSLAPMQMLRAFAESENITFFDATPYFLNATADASEYPLYYPYDGHFTVKGQQLYGDSLTQFMSPIVKAVNAS